MTTGTIRHRIILAALLALAAQPAVAGVRLVSSDARSAVVEYACDGPAFGAAGQDYQTLQLDGCRLDGAPGQPGLPLWSICSRSHCSRPAPTLLILRLARSCW